LTETTPSLPEDMTSIDPIKRMIERRGILDPFKWLLDNPNPELTGTMRRGQVAITNEEINDRLNKLKYL
jgi:hypothetical protein